MGKHALALLAALDTACVAVTELGQASAELFQQRPDYSVPTTDSATWWPTSAAASAASRLRVEVSKNSVTAASSKEGERVFRGPASEPPWV